MHAKNKDLFVMENLNKEQISSMKNVMSIVNRSARDSVMDVDLRDEDERF